MREARLGEAIEFFPSGRPELVTFMIAYGSGNARQVDVLGKR
jgi:hypothetical protein